MDQQVCLCSEEALAKGAWVKLICGASNHDLPAISDLCALYASAGVHCIDVAADPAVVYAARKGLDWVQSLGGKRPLLMISLSDGEDEHFRKAWFDPNRCPLDCSRPCQKICPAKAIADKGGINASRCYGCGRCVPRCPLGLIEEQNQNLAFKDFAPLIAELCPDAIEIHTAPGRSREFQNALGKILSADVPFKRVAVSCGLQGHGISIAELVQELWDRHSCLREYGQKPLWQLDGQRMSGDLGSGTGRVAVALWQKVREFAPPGPLNLAGGTNGQTINYIADLNGPSGIAFGGMARKLIQPWLLQAEANQTSLREWPEGWEAALKEAKKLISPWLMRSAQHQAVLKPMKWSAREI